MLLQSLIGGLLIGGAVALLLLGRGQIAGISGIFGNLITGESGAGHWRAAFIAGLLLAPLLALPFTHALPQVEIGLGAPGLIVAGLLVGVGTQLGSGCTSGHGVCGIGNLSLRSLVATLTFMGVGAVTVFVVRHLLGG
jgi:uncharacterized membrane protein YedE/YeeE